MLFIGIAGLRSGHAVDVSYVSTQETVTVSADWQKEFDDVCSRTQDAMTFSAEELTLLLRRCDALLLQIEKLDDTQKKVYMRRLQMCRGLYVYVLNSKTNKKN